MPWRFPADSSSCSVEAGSGSAAVITHVALTLWVHQVNERLSWNNPDSCPADCALPFLSCPPFNTSQPPCNGMGVCYNSIGSCSCTTGYAGSDCSICALNFKRVNGFCVAEQQIAPRTCLNAACNASLNAGTSLLPQVVTAPRSLAGGQAAVATVMVGTMLVVIGAAVVVYRKRQEWLMAEHEAAARQEAENYHG
jgi:hypothetical protein